MNNKMGRGKGLARSIPAQNYTVRELAMIFGMSRELTIRYLRYFNIPIVTKERCRLYIDADMIRTHNVELYSSIQLALLERCSKPFYTVRDISRLMNRSYRTALRFVTKAHHIPKSICGNRIVILASDYLASVGYRAKKNE